jgi:hypothetical protein
MTPLVRATQFKAKHDDKLVKITADRLGCSVEEALKVINEDLAQTETWVNEKYQVAARRFDHPNLGPCMQLNIRRRDGNVIFRDWREFQEIKNQLAGRESEGLEIYPAESRKVDSSNKYHIWCVLNAEDEEKRIPFGWDERDVMDTQPNDGPGTRQRPLPKYEPEARKKRR